MKHLLNNLSEEEKNRIREQHEGGMRVNTDRFKTLLESKVGDVKPLVNEQSTQSTPLTKLKQTASKISMRDALLGKTVNLYSDKENKELFASGSKIVYFDDSTGRPTIRFGNMPRSKFIFQCEEKSFWDYDNGPKYNTPLANSLYKEYCTKSSGGETVPKADFASTGSEQTPPIA